MKKNFILKALLISIGIVFLIPIKVNAEEVSISIYETVSAVYEEQPVYETTPAVYEEQPVYETYTYNVNGEVVRTWVDGAVTWTEYGYWNGVGFGYAGTSWTNTDGSSGGYCYPPKTVTGTRQIGTESVMVTPETTVQVGTESVMVTPETTVQVGTKSVLVSAEKKVQVGTKNVMVTPEIKKQVGTEKVLVLKNNETIVSVLKITSSKISNSETNLKATVSNESLIKINEWLWNVGDKTNSINVTKNGTYTVTLKYVINGIEESKELSIDINDIEIANTEKNVEEVDKKAPEINFEVYNLGDHTKLKVVAIDESGLSENAYSFDNGETWSSNNEINNIILNGEYKVLVKDFYGNIATDSIILDDVENNIIIHEEEMAKMATFTVTSTASTSSTSVLFFLTLWIFSSAKIYKKNVDGKWILLGKARIKKGKKNKYKLIFGITLKRKIKKENLKELQIVCPKRFSNKNNKNIELIYNNKNYIIQPEKAFVIKL